MELLEVTLLGEEELPGVGEEGEGAWTEMREVEAGVSTPTFDLDQWQDGGVNIDFIRTLSYLCSKSLELCASAYHTLCIL